MKYRNTLKPLCCALCIISYFLAGCDLQTKTYCIKIADESLTEWNGCDCEAESGKYIIFFPIENAALPERFHVKRVNTIGVDQEMLDAVLSCFSERELLVAEAFKLYEKNGKLWNLHMPYTGLPKNTYPDFFSADGDAVVIKSPYTGNDIRLRDVAAIKFKGTPLIIVPSL